MFQNISIAITVLFYCASINATTLSDISDYLALPESEIDVTMGKFLIDEIMDKSFNRNVYIAKLNEMLQDLQSHAVDGYVTVNVVRDYVFESVELNNYQPYDYDIDNALVFNKPVMDCDLLYKTIDTKKGRCITMTVLYYTLLYYTGHPVTFGSDPNHLYVIYMGNDDPNDDYALETSDKGKFFRDREFDAKRPKKGVESGAYSRRLNKKECIASMLVTLQNYYFKTNRYDLALEVTNIALKHYPLNIESILNKALSLRKIDASDADRVQLEKEAVALTNKAYDLGYDPAHSVGGKEYEKFVAMKKKELAK